MNNYIILEILNAGNFGKVVKAENKYTKKEVAIKIETKESNTLKYESEIYKFLNNILNIPKLKGFITNDKNNYLITDLLDYNLKYYKENIIKSQNKIFNIKIVIIKLIEILKNIHKKGVIHRDIKPENICFKNEEPYLIDFGLAKRIIVDNTHINFKTINSIIGTPNYVSMNVVNNIEPTRRDDLESLGYIFIYLYLDEPIFNKYDSLKLKLKKDETIISGYIDTVEVRQIIYTYLTYCKTLKFDEMPDYNYLQYLFR